MLLILNKSTKFNVYVWFCTGLPLNLQILLLLVVVVVVAVMVGVVSKLEHISCLHRLPCMKYMNKS